VFTQRARKLRGLAKFPQAVEAGSPAPTHYTVAEAAGKTKRREEGLILTPMRCGGFSLVGSLHHLLTFFNVP